jgi:hypothetical protein
VDLTRVDDPEGVGGAVAAQLGFPSFTALLDSPSEQPALLVVDNCEHVLDAAAEAIDALLGACDAPSVVATSRSPLDLPGEGVVVVISNSDSFLAVTVDDTLTATTLIGLGQQAKDDFAHRPNAASDDLYWWHDGIAETITLTGEQLQLPQGLAELIAKE